MTRRCCGDTCLCVLNPGDDSLSNDSIIIDGTGSQQTPFVISFRGIDVDNSANEIDLTLDYDGGETGLGYVLSATFSDDSSLNDLGDVNAPAPTNGQVLSFDTGTGMWVAAAAPTAAPGAISSDTSLDGDGSVGAPLVVAHSPDRFTDTFADGIGLTDEGINNDVRHFADDAARALADPPPILNSLSMLDTNPGEIDYWDGTEWLPQRQLSAVDVNEAFMELSGPYDGRPVQLMIRNDFVTMDGSGAFVAFSAADLAGYAGVLAVTSQITSIPEEQTNLYLTNGSPGEVAGYALHPGGTAASDEILVACFTAYLY
jgi:hypothetical protein